MAGKTRRSSKTPRSKWAFRSAVPAGRLSGTVDAASGFTLIEVIIALMILAVALVTMIGLQSAASNRTLRDQRIQQALLLGRKVMSRYEAGIRKLDLGRQDLSGEDLAGSEEDPNAASELRVSVEITNADTSFLPDVEPDAVKRINVIVYWGDAPEESVTLDYFVLKDDDQIT